MKIFRSLAIFGISLLSFESAYAGVGSSGGGIGVLCGNHLRILDLYEAEEIFHEVINRQGDLDSALLQFAPSISEYFYYRNPPSTQAEREQTAEGVKQLFTQRLEDIPSGQKLPLSNDATLPPMLPGCSLVQIALFDDASDTIKRDRVLWDQLNPENQAALILHEYWYKVARTRSSTSSDDTRRMIGLLMAGNLPESMMKPISGKKSLGCAVGGLSGPGPQEKFDLNIIDEVKNGQAGVGIYFRRFKNNFQMGRTSLFIPNLSIEKIANEDFSTIQASATEEVFNRHWSVEMAPVAKTDPRTTNPGYFFITFSAWAQSESIPGVSILSCMENFYQRF